MNFTSANLYGADFRGAKFGKDEQSRPNFTDAIIDEYTKDPPDWAKEQCRVL